MKRKLKIILLGLIVILARQPVFSDHDSEKIVIFTDCAIDDLRAICQLLAIHDVEVKGIVAGDGMLEPEEGSQKVMELLNELKIYNIPVAKGKNLKYKNTEHHDILMSVRWGEVLENNETIQDATCLLENIFSKVEDDIIVICLGNLTDISIFLKKHPEDSEKIHKIIWYNTYVSPFSGTNYNIDSCAAEQLLSMKIQIDVISNLNSNEALINEKFINQLSQIETPFADIVAKAHHLEKMKEIVISGKMMLWDDLIPVYLLYPGLFDMSPVEGKPWIFSTSNADFESIKEKMLQIYGQKTSFGKNIVFEDFPVDSNLFDHDLKPLISELLIRYGKDEWKICVLTNEIHGHLGTYSIVGAKMGLKAREILNAEIDRVMVISYAGNIPPFSCLNDGLQISTGATLGLGMIKISEENVIYPAAVFSYNGRKIKLTLKKTIQEKIDNDISLGIQKYGKLTQGYWKFIREVSLKHWLEFDRNEIFEVEEIK